MEPRAAVPIIKTIFLLAIYLIGIQPVAVGDTFQSPIAFLPSAEQIYLGTVKSVGTDEVTFTVNESLRGKTLSSLMLKPWNGNIYAVGSYWILASNSNGVSKGVVGLDPKGDCGWTPMSVGRKDGQSFVVAESDQVVGINLDMASDGTKGLTLDHIRRLLKQKPKKGLPALLSPAQ